MEGNGEGGGLGVRKGAWTKEEDILLTKCIEEHGEGKWHLVPSRAVLNRCRKSCRLRWLNYLKPTIKRGQFAPDEVDLIIRLHNLLGNRWTLIAGRLPGRTANDIKNYWNAHLLKKTTSAHTKNIISKPNPNPHPSNPNNNIVIKPRPQRLSRKKFPLLQGENNDEDGATNEVAESMNGDVSWWELLLMEDGKEVDDEHKHQTAGHRLINNNNQSWVMGEEPNNNTYNWDQLFSDADLWNDFNPELDNLV